MKLVPMHGRVLIEGVNQINGIIIPETTNSMHSKRGRVVAIADGVVSKLRVGDEVYVGTTNVVIDHVHFAGKDYLLTEATGVIARVTEDE